MTFEYLVVTKSKKTKINGFCQRDTGTNRGNLLAKFETICTRKRIMNAVDCKRLNI